MGDQDATTKMMERTYTDVLTMSLISNGESFNAQIDIVSENMVITLPNNKIGEVLFCFSKSQILDISRIKVVEENGYGFNIKFDNDGVKDTLCIYEMNSKMAKAYNRFVKRMMTL